MNIKYKLVHESTKWTKDMRIEQIQEREERNFIVGKQDWVAMQLLIENNEMSVVKPSGIETFSPYGELPSIRVEACVEGIDKSLITTQLVGYIQDDDGAYKPDILLSQESMTVEADAIGAVWIEVSIPRDLEVGVYNGCIRILCQQMFRDEIEVGEINFTIDVKDVVVERPIDSKFHLDLWQHNANIARKHEVYCYSDAHFEIMEEYIKTLADLGQKVSTVVVSEAPWVGQCCYDVKDYPSDLFEYSIVKIYRDAKGKYIYNFDALKRYIELCFKYGIDKEIELVGLASVWGNKDSAYIPLVENYGDCIRLRYYDEITKSYKYVTSIEGVKDYIGALAVFFRNMGWMDKVRIIADEPADEEVYREAINLVLSIDKGFKFKAAINSVDFIVASQETVTDFIPILPIVTNQWEQIQEARKYIKGKLHYYVCCGPDYPNTFINSPLVESRLIGIITSLLGLDGFLRWNYTVWPEDPRNRLSYKQEIWKAGDTNFVYPSKGGKPLLSLRYKMLKRGIEDYSLLERVKEKYGEESEEVRMLFELLFDKAVIDKPQLFYSTHNESNDGKCYEINHEAYEVMKAKLLELLQ